VVRRARDLRDGELVAVKMFHPGASALDRRQQRREMDALTRLDHPGLVGLHDGGTEAGRLYVVTDLVEGPTLAERIKAGPLPPDEVCRVGAGLAAALAHVHAGGFVHRDMKPANVLLGDGGGPRLADFGISRALDSTVATEAGYLIGTAAYLAPEQVRGDDVGPPADVYALALVLLEALTGVREYPGRAVESATARLYRPPRVPAGLPGGLSPLLEAMTADDPAQRPEAELVASLLAPPAPDAVHLAGDASQPDPPEHGRHRRRATRMPSAAPLAAAVLVLVAIGGVAAVVFGGSGPGEPQPAPPAGAVVTSEPAATTEPVPADR
jgi:serine/threonine protein kinase